MFINSTTKFDLDNYNKELWFIDYAKITDIDNLPGEIWYSMGIVDGVDYTGYYEASNLSRARSINRYIIDKNGRVCFLKGKILKPTKENNGYYTVSLKRKNINIHRIIGALFVENDDPEHKTFINHKDENKLNNLPENLEWCTNKYNLFYGTAPERRAKTLKEKYANGEIILNPPHIKKPVIQTDLEGNYIKTWDGAIDVEQYGYNSDMVNACCRQRTLTHKNCFWMYEKDFTPENIESKIKKLQNITNIPTKVVQLNIDNTLVKVWNSISETQQEGYRRGSVVKCCRGQRNKYHGYKWMYLSDYEKLNS